MKWVRFIGSSRDDLAALARFAEAVYVLHAFQKKTQKTSQADLDLTKQRYRLGREFAAGVKRG